MDFPKRGEIYLVNFDPTVGAEVKKARPAVIITNNLNNMHSPVLTVIPLSSNVKRIFPFEVFMSAQEGLDKDSKILVNQIRTVDKKRLIKKLTFTSPSILKKIEKAIKLHFGMDSEID